MERTGAQARKGMVQNCAVHFSRHIWFRAGPVGLGETRQDNTDLADTDQADTKADTRLVLARLLLLALPTLAQLLTRM